MGDASPKVGILGSGSYAPEKIVTNDDLSKIVDTSDEWIFSRTGIRERHFARDDEYTSTMSAEAIKRACEDAGCGLDEVEYILVATATPDMRFPNTAAWTCDALGLKGIAALDISTACAGWLYALEIAKGLVASGMYKKVAAVGAEKLTSIMDMTDRSTCVLFGDGAGAAIVGEGGHEILHTRSYCHFNWEALYLKGPGSRFPMTEETWTEKHNLIRMNGREVYRFVVSQCVDIMKQAMREHGVGPDDIALFLPHQANANMLRFAADKAGIPEDKLFLDIHKYGNTSSASIPLAISDAREEGRIKDGDLIFMIAFGGGLSSSYAMVRW